MSALRMSGVRDLFQGSFLLLFPLLFIGCVDLPALNGD
jgi:hypothetical protein